MLIAAGLTIPALLLELDRANRALHEAGLVANWVIWTAFLIELLVMLAVVPSRRAWLRQHPIEVVVVVLTPLFVVSAVQGVRVLRALRLLRLVRVAPLARTMFSVSGLPYVALLALLVLLIGGEAFAQAKGITAGNGIYWALTTMTTVGYGDITPKTDSGKVIASALMLVGIGFFAILTGAIAQRFLASEVKDVEEAVAVTEAVEQDLLVQVRDISVRLRQLEGAIARGQAPHTRR